MDRSLHQGRQQSAEQRPSTSRAARQAEGRSQAESWVRCQPNWAGWCFQQGQVLAQLRQSPFALGARGMQVCQR